MSAASWINTNVYGATTPNAPGNYTGPLQTQPVQNADGTYTDPATGQTYTKNPITGGFDVTTNPTVTQQVGNLTQQAAGYANKVPGYDQREQGAFNQEQSLAGTLQGQAAGVGPTVAGTQLATGLDQAARSQLAQAAGASGSGAALARLAAMSNTGNLQAQTNQQQALARTQEQQNAINGLGNLTGNMEQQSAGMAGQNLSAAQGLNNLAMQGETGHEDLNEQSQLANATQNKNTMNSVFSALGNLFSGGGTSGAASGASSGGSGGLLTKLAGFL